MADRILSSMVTVKTKNMDNNDHAKEVLNHFEQYLKDKIEQLNQTMDNVSPDLLSAYEDSGPYYTCLHKLRELRKEKAV